MTLAQNVGAALIVATKSLAEAGIDTARLDARLLMAHALGLTPEQVFGNPDRLLQPDEQERFSSLVEKRARRQPLAQIVGFREFWSLDFVVTPDTLCPRPDSETLIETVLATVAGPDGQPDVLDLGTGSGCLLLALLHELPKASGLGVDISESALDVARLNADALGLDGRADFVVGNWMAGLGNRRFDVIVCNPPYIPEADRDSLMPEVADHEPAGALFAGSDGLDAYRVLIPGMSGTLKPGGHVFFEVGAGQSEPVSAMLKQAGFGGVDVARDLAGHGRCVHASS